MAIVLSAGLLVAASALTPAVAFASSLPSSPSNGSFYVDSNWTYSYAYSEAYNNATPGTGNGKYLVIDFGRQYWDSIQGWGVHLTTNQTYETNSWVENVTQGFIDGYSAAHPNSGDPIAQIVVGTNNDMSYSAQSSWTDAGTSWGDAIANHITQKYNTFIKAGNDIEAWGCGSNCSGSNTIAWMNAFGAYNLINLNYGNNTAFLDPADWTQQQLYTVSWGATPATVAPEIYCAGNDIQWATTNSDNGGSLIFDSVTSADGAQVVTTPGETCQNGSQDGYSWSDSWNLLYNALNNDGGYGNNLDSDVIVIPYRTTV